MSAAHSLPSGSPADLPVYPLDETGRFVQIGNLRTILTADLSVVLAELLAGAGRIVTYDHILNRLYLDRRREEPETSLDSLKVKVCGLRKLGLDIRNVSSAGYMLTGVRDDFLDEEAAGV